MNTKKRFLTVFLALLITSSMAFTVMAYDAIDANITRIGSVATSGTDCSAIEGLSVTASGNNNRLFVVKVDPNTDNTARLFMYKDYTTMDDNADEYGVFTLSNLVGHANGMAIDDDYIYITCWKDTNGDNGNKIVRISRSMLWNKYKSTTKTNKDTLTSSSDGVTILTAKYASGTKYDKKIKTITYYKDGKFIINYPLHQDGDSGESRTGTFTFTTATVSGNYFLVNSSDSEVFQVSSGIKGSTQQDIGYDPNCGFFISRWLNGAGTNNSIIWIKLNSLNVTKRVYTPTNSKYRIINVTGNTSKYTDYEVESVSIGSDNCMYASVNTITASRGYDGNYSQDAIIKIERPTAVGGSKNFLGNYFTQG